MKPRYWPPVVLTLGEIGYAAMPIQTLPASWQVLQPPVMPAWIMAPVGAGVAKAVPGAVLVDDAGISPAGVEPRWQASQTSDEGMCDVGPAGDLGGITTMALTPAKLAPLIDGPWQAAQLLVMPAWLISEPAKLAPLPTGRLVMLEPAPTWQLSQAVVMGMWLAGGPLMVKLADGMAKPATTLAP